MQYAGVLLYLQPKSGYTFGGLSCVAEVIRERSKGTIRDEYN